MTKKTTDRKTTNYIIFLFGVWATRFGWIDSPSLSLAGINPWDCRPSLTKYGGINWDDYRQPGWPLPALREAAREFYLRRRGWELVFYPIHDSRKKSKMSADYTVVYKHSKLAGTWSSSAAVKTQRDWEK